MDTDALEDFATRYTAAWCSQDPASVAAFFAEDGSLQVNDGEPAVGRDAITEVARGFMTAFPDMVVEMEGYKGLGNPIKLARTPPRPGKRPPRFGEDTRAVLAALGYSEQEIDGLLRTGIARDGGVKTAAE